MLVCSNCHHEQDSGKFCEKCGKHLVAKQVEVEVASTQEVSYTNGGAGPNDAGNPNVETAKNALREYGAYFMKLLKNPTHAFSANERYFYNGLITIALYTILLSLALYFYANSIVKTMGFLFGSSLPFSINFRLIIFILIVIAIAFFSAFAIIKIAKHPGSFQSLVAQFGGLLVPFTLLHAIGLIGGLVGSDFLTLVPIALSVSLSISFIPVLFVYEKVSHIDNNGQKVYLSLGTVVLMGIIFYILGEAVLSSMLEELSMIFDYIL
ncbi:zinc ribbon domain-containing protein [Oceanobacillus sp. Castelsardo]|uniref:zinc ribbon domain-containing protein n=1 Tax=Oceanobacillus sp. Castelsardo TaxID=1851204 RepID=UPI000837CB59|nr:zinc ribbon domain-containing protein [Oceanobacillus sp. Castelsardo]